MSQIRISVKDHVKNINDRAAAAEVQTPKSAERLSSPGRLPPRRVNESPYINARDSKSPSRQQTPPPQLLRDFVIPALPRRTDYNLRDGPAQLYRPDHNNFVDSPIALRGDEASSDVPNQPDLLSGHPHPQESTAAEQTSMSVTQVCEDAASATKDTATVPAHRATASTISNIPVTNEAFGRRKTQVFAHPATHGHSSEPRQTTTVRIVQMLYELGIHPTHREHEPDAPIWSGKPCPHHDHGVPQVVDVQDVPNATAATSDDAAKQETQLAADHTKTVQQPVAGSPDTAHVAPSMATDVTQTSTKPSDPDTKVAGARETVKPAPTDAVPIPNDKQVQPIVAVTDHGIPSGLFNALEPTALKDPSTDSLPVHPIDQLELVNSVISQVGDRRSPYLRVNARGEKVFTPMTGRRSAGRSSSDQTTIVMRSSPASIEIEVKADAAAGPPTETSAETSTVLMTTETQVASSSQAVTLAERESSCAQEPSVPLSMTIHTSSTSPDPEIAPTVNASRPIQSTHMEVEVGPMAVSSETSVIDRPTEAGTVTQVGLEPYKQGETSALVLTTRPEAPIPLRQERADSSIAAQHLFELPNEVPSTSEQNNEAVNGAGFTVPKLTATPFMQFGEPSGLPAFGPDGRPRSSTSGDGTRVVQPRLSNQLFIGEPPATTGWIVIKHQVADASTTLTGVIPESAPACDSGGLSEHEVAKTMATHANPEIESTMIEIDMTVQRPSSPQASADAITIELHEPATLPSPATNQPEQSTSSQPLQLSKALDFFLPTPAAHDTVETSNDIGITSQTQRQDAGSQSSEPTTALSVLIGTSREGSRMTGTVIIQPTASPQANLPSALENSHRDPAEAITSASINSTPSTPRATVQYDTTRQAFRTDEGSRDHTDASIYGEVGSQIGSQTSDETHFKQELLGLAGEMQNAIIRHDEAVAAIVRNITSGLQERKLDVVAYTNLTADLLKTVEHFARKYWQLNLERQAPFPSRTSDQEQSERAKTFAGDRLAMPKPLKPAKRPIAALRSLSCGDGLHRPRWEWPTIDNDEDSVTLQQPGLQDSIFHNCEVLIRPRQIHRAQKLSRKDDSSGSDVLHEILDIHGRLDYFRLPVA